MTFQEYTNYFRKIIDTPVTEQQLPYNEPDYLEYAKLNWSRMNRWLKSGALSDEILSAVKKVNSPQSWIVITEPWCGDAAHIVPFIELMSRKNSHITVSYELRDNEPFSIQHYLTNGSKSIPKLIIRNAKGEDKGVWGPRPKDCQKIYVELKKKSVPFEEAKIELQKWYNANKGKQLQEELSLVLRNSISSPIEVGHVL